MTQRHRQGSRGSAEVLAVTDPRGEWPHSELERGRIPEQVVEWALGELAEGLDIGVIAINQTSFAGGARQGMAWYGQCAEAHA